MKKMAMNLSFAFDQALEGLTDNDGADLVKKRSKQYESWNMNKRQRL